MLIYCAHKYGGNRDNVIKASEIMRVIQLADTDNTYICPLTVFLHLRYGELAYEDEMKMCIEVLAKCDKLLVLSEPSKGVKIEIGWAMAHGMPIRYYGGVKGDF